MNPLEWEDRGAMLKRIAQLEAENACLRDGWYAALEQTCAELEAENERLRKALQLIRGNYHCQSDCGDVASEALGDETND